MDDSDPPRNWTCWMGFYSKPMAHLCNNNCSKMYLIRLNWCLMAAMYVCWCSYKLHSIYFGPFAEPEANFPFDTIRAALHPNTLVSMAIPMPVQPLYPISSNSSTRESDDTCRTLRAGQYGWQKRIFFFRISSNRSTRHKCASSHSILIFLLCVTKILAHFSNI